ncbi:MAG TPA: hypothetical protein VGE94_09985 [Chloroflexota bacterium]
MPSGLNRALQVRAADRLRAALRRDAASGLPVVDGLSEVDQRELCDVGGGRLAVVAIRVEPGLVREAALLVEQQVRRTDLLGALDEGTLLVLAPGLDSIGGAYLVERLRALLGDISASVGVAYRSSASATGWTPRALAAEAELHAAA